MANTRLSLLQAVLVGATAICSKSWFFNLRAYYCAPWQVEPAAPHHWISCDWPECEGRRSWATRSVRCDERRL